MQLNQMARTNSIIVAGWVAPDYNRYEQTIPAGTLVKIFEPVGKPPYQQYYCRYLDAETFEMKEMWILAKFLDLIND